MAVRRGTAMAKKNDTKTTPEKRARFLSLLSECGNVSRAARLAKLNRTALYDFYEKDPEFAGLWDKCAKLGAYALKDEARRRATEGILNPIFYKGQKCGVKREFSDTLLICLLKAAFPDEFAERKKAEVTTPEPITIRVIMPGESAAQDPEPLQAEA